MEPQQFLLSMALLLYLQHVISTLICISFNFLLYIEKTTIPCCFKMHCIRSWFHWGKSTFHWTQWDSEQAFSFLKETFSRISMSTQSQELFFFFLFTFFRNIYPDIWVMSVFWDWSLNPKRSEMPTPTVTYWGEEANK